MSLDGRLKQGFANLADPISVDYELGLVRVRAVARQRERRNVMIAAFAGATAAIALMVAGSRLADMVLGIEMPVPPAIERVIDEKLPDREGRTEESKEVDEKGISKPDDLNDALEKLAASQDTGSTTAMVSVPRRTEPRADSGGESPVEQATGGDEEEEKPKPVSERREDSATYAGAAIPIGGGRSACDQGQQGAGCVSFQTQPGERTVEISITDRSGAPVAAWVQIDRDGNGDVDGEWTAICSATQGPISIPTTGDAVVYVEINGGACADGTDSNPTQGDVAAVFAT